MYKNHRWAKVLRYKFCQFIHITAPHSPFNKGEVNAQYKFCEYSLTPVRIKIGFTPEIYSFNYVITYVTWTQYIR